jgi:hypothetical protein
MADETVTIAVASRPYPGESRNGDGWAVQWHAGRCRIAVIDGLGHGPEAARATERAQAALADHPDLDPLAAVAQCHRALAGTRGAAMAIATVDPGERVLGFVGIGNVEAQLWQDGITKRPAPYRGIVGVQYRTLRQFDLQLASQWWLLLYTDGIRSSIDVNALADELRQDPQAAADAALARWGRATDDATVLVACAASRDDGPAGS